MMDLAPSKPSSTLKSRNRAAHPKPASSLKDHPQGNPRKPSSPTPRSRSVSAMSTSSSDVVSHLSNTRDNPLFCCSSSSSSSSPDSETKAISGGRDAFPHRPHSLSRTGSGKRRLRSVSDEHYRNSESELERGYKSASSTGSKAMETGGASTDKLDDSEETRSLHKWTDQHPVPECWETSTAQNWEDRVSTSFSVAEDVVIRVPFRRDPPINNDGADGIYETVRSEVQWDSE